MNAAERKIGLLELEVNKLKERLEELEGRSHQKRVRHRSPNAHKSAELARKAESRAQTQFLGGMKLALAFLTAAAVLYGGFELVDFVTELYTRGYFR